MENKPLSPWLWYLTALPIVYLATIYGDLPERIPIHYDARGIADRWGHKSTLWALAVVPLFISILYARILPWLDKRGGLEQMGSHYEKMATGTVAALSLIMTYILYNAGAEQMQAPKIIFVIVGALVAMVGNFMPAIRPNRFVGVRTPWTLKNDKVWRKTHREAGPLWFWGGLVSIVFSLVLPVPYGVYVFLSIVLVISAIPIYRSYQIFREEKGEDFV